MKIFYCGCKSIMRAERMSFPRNNKANEVSEKVGTKLLKIDGFYPSMNEDAKKALAFNTKREKIEKEKLKTGTTIIHDDSLADEVESLKAQLEEAVDGSQLGSLTAENEQLKANLVEVGRAGKEVIAKNTELAKELKTCQAKLTAIEMTNKTKS